MVSALWLNHFLVHFLSVQSDWCFHSIFFFQVCNPFFICPWKWCFNTAQTFIRCVLNTFSLFNQLFYGMTFICIVSYFHQTTSNQQTQNICGYWKVLDLLWWVLFMCLHLSCLRSAGGLYKAGRAENSPVMWHCAENPLPDMSRRSAHAQTEASDHTQRPQGLFLVEWIMCQRTAEWLSIHYVQ